MWAPYTQRGASQPLPAAASTRSPLARLRLTPASLRENTGASETCFSLPALLLSSGSLRIPFGNPTHWAARPFLSPEASPSPAHPRASEGSLPRTGCPQKGGREPGVPAPSPGFWGAWGLHVDRGVRKGFPSGCDSEGPAPRALWRRVWTVAISGQDLYPGRGDH